MLALILTSLIAFLQAPAPQTGTLAVLVVERQTNAPLSGVRVSIVNSETRPAVQEEATTAADGTVTFTGLSVGRYHVRTWSKTHLANEEPLPGSGGVAIWFPGVADDQEVLRHLPGSASVRVRPGRRLDLRFELPLGGVITGRHISPETAQVTAMVTLYSTYKSNVSGGLIRRSQGRVKTETDGSFEFGPLLRGAYLLTFQPWDDDTDGFSEVYFPNTVDLRDATPLNIATRTRVDLPPIKFVAVPRVRISGAIEDVGDGRRELVGRDLDISRGDVISNAVIPVRRNGTFSAPNVDAGLKGLLYTRRARDGSLLTAGTAVIHVGAKPLTGIRLTPVAPATISGRFVFERPYEPGKNDLDPQLYLGPLGPDAWLRENLSKTEREKDHQFRIQGIIGLHRIDARAPVGWVVSGILLEDGRNILDTSFRFEPGMHYRNLRVLLSPDAATIEGRILLTPKTEVFRRLMVFPVDESLWRVVRYTHLADFERDGSFRIPAITPGREYFVTTCEWPCAMGAEDLERLARNAVRIFIDRPGGFTVTLKR